MIGTLHRHGLFTGGGAAGLPAFPSASNIVLLYDRTAASPVSLFAAQALTTCNNAGAGTTVLAHAAGVATFNGESVEISGCTGAFAELNGTHTLTASASNTFSINTPLGLAVTVGAVSITGTPVFNPVLRWVSQINDQSGNGYHLLCNDRANCFRWDASLLEFMFPHATAANIRYTADATQRAAFETLVNGKAGVQAFVLKKTASIGQAIINSIISGGSNQFGCQFSSNNVFRQEIAATSLDYNDAVNNNGNTALYIATHNAVNARAIYRNTVGSAVASSAGSQSPGSNSALRGLGHYAGGFNMRGRMMLGVLYADTAFAGSGELAALKDAIDARVAAYPGM
jgi:hypothetical protein